MPEPVTPLPTPQDACWTPEEALRLLQRAALPLEPQHIAPLGRGWDADVFLVDEAWVLRLPRNPAAAAGFERELLISAWLAPHLPLAIPEPQANLAGPCGIADWRFVMSRLIPGETITDTALGRAERAALARPLGELMAALHALDPASAPAPITADPYDRFDTAARLPKTRQSLELLATANALPANALAALRELIEAGPPPLETPPRHYLVHADLHRRNLLVDPAGQLCGAIDWVDLHLGERATDLATLFTVLPPEAHADFLAAYGEVSPGDLGRARWRAAVHMTLALQGSLDRNDPRFAASCRSALQEITE